MKIKIEYRDGDRTPEVVNAEVVGHGAIPDCLMSYLVHRGGGTAIAFIPDTNVEHPEGEPIDAWQRWSEVSYEMKEDENTYTTVELGTKKTVLAEVS